MDHVQIVAGLRRGMPRLYVWFSVEKVRTGSLLHALWGSFAALTMTTGSFPSTTLGVRMIPIGKSTWEVNALCRSEIGTSTDNPASLGTSGASIPYWFSGATVCVHVCFL